MLVGDKLNRVFLFLRLGSIGFSILMLHLNILIGILRFFNWGGNKTTARDKKNEGQDQDAYDVILNRTPSIRPHENASSYLPDA